MMGEAKVKAFLKIGLIGVMAVIVVTVFLLNRTTPLHEKEVVKKAVDAYIYAYPLITFDMVRRHETNTEVPTGAAAPMGQVIKMRKYPAVDDHAAAAKAWRTTSRSLNGSRASPTN